MRKRRLAAALVGAAALAGIPVMAAAQVSATTSATFHGAVEERDGADVRYCGGAGERPCASGDPVQVSWGIGGSGDRSSLGFTPANAARLGDEFTLGTLKHMNTVVGTYNGITEVHLRVDTTVRDLDRSVTFSRPLDMPLGVREVINNLRDCPYGGTPGQCADAIVLPSPREPYLVEMGNVLYRFDIKGFRDRDGNLTDNTVSPEDDSTVVRLVAQLTKLPRIDADAGPDQAVDEGSLVTLDGSGSRYSDLTYEWRQVSGPTVTLDDPTAVRPTFPVGLFTEDQTLEFELTVHDRLEPVYADSDRVRVTVRDLNDPPTPTATSTG